MENRRIVPEIAGRRGRRRDERDRPCAAARRRAGLPGVAGQSAHGSRNRR